jgi:signal transduction histidine kinase
VLRPAAAFDAGQLQHYDGVMGHHTHGARSHRIGPALRRVADRLTIRGASGIDLVRRFREVEMRASAVQRRLAETEDLLSTVRTQVLLGSVYLRDALLGTPDSAQNSRMRLEQTRVAIEQALQAYVPVADSPGERATFVKLRAEIRDFWETVLPVLAWEPERRATEARAVLRNRIIPKREVIIRISDQIRDLNRVASEKQQAELRQIYAVVRRRVWEASAEVLVIGLAVAFFVTRHVARLERRILENTRSLQQLSSKLVGAQEEERRTIARELHDEIGQELTGVKVELALAERAIEAQTGSANPLTEAKAMTERALQTVRDLSQLLHPPMLDDLGLVATLDWFLAGFSRRTGIAARLEQEGADARLVPELEMCLYRIVQEASTNVARHSGATRCRVNLRRVSGRVSLTVEDDGKGFVLENLASGAGRAGLGLLGIQERVAGFGGRFRVETAPGRGTRLVADLPDLTRPITDHELDTDITAAEPQGAR